MIPTHDDLERISRLREGGLDQVPFAVLLQALASRERTVVLEVYRRQLSKKIVLEHGAPVDCRSNLVHETFGRFLVSIGRLEEGKLHALLGESAARGMPMGEVLVERGLLTSSDLFRLLQQNLAKKLLDLFTWHDGAFRMLFDVPEVQSSLKVKVPQLVLTGVTRFAAQEEVDAALAPLDGVKLVAYPGAAEVLAELKLTPIQSGLAGAFERGATLQQIAMVTGVPAEEVGRFAYALGVLGLAGPADRVAGAALAAPQRPRPAAAPAAPAAAAAPTAAASEAEAEVEARRADVLMKTYLAYRRLDPFDLLGVGEDDPPAAVAERFLAYARRTAPWSFAGDLADQARDLFLAGARFYAQLADPEQRTTLLFRRRTLRAERDRRPSGMGSIQTELLDPAVQYAKGVAAVEAGKLREAVTLFEFASDCDPANPVYRAELAYARYLLAPETAGPKTARELDAALRLDPGCGIALYYAGLVHADLGEHDQAEAHLRRAIKAMAPDRRPIEALKSLKPDKKH